MNDDDTLREHELWRRALESFDKTPSDLFVAALKSPDCAIVWAGIRGLGLQREGLDALIQLFNSNSACLSETSVQTQLAWALAQLEVSHPLDLGADAPLSDVTIQQRVILADYLGECGKVAGLPVLARFVQDAEWDVALWATLSLAKIGRLALSTIEQLISDESLNTNRKALLLNALGKIGSAEARDIAEDAMARQKETLASYRELYEAGLNQ